MKKILSILGAGALMISPLVKISNHFQNSNRNLEPSLEEYGNNNLSYNPTYPNIYKTFSDVKSEQAVAKIESGGDDSDEKTTSTTIELADYGQNKDSVKNGFNGFNLKFTWWYWFNDYDEVQITESHNFTWTEVGNGYYQVAKAMRSGDSDRNVAYLKTKASWKSETEIELTGFVRVEVRGHIWTYYETTSSVQIDSVSFNSQYTWENTKKNLESNLAKAFDFNSNTSPNLDSEEKKSIIDGKEVESNVQIIKQHVVDVLKSSLAGDYEQWMEYVDWKLTFENNSKKVKVSFQNKNGNNFVDSSFPASITFQANIKFDAKGIEARIREVMEKTFSIESGTSPNISDTSTETTSGQVKSNHDKVFEEIDQRINQIFGSNSAWLNLIKIAKNIDDTKNIVMVDFVDSGGNFIEEGQWVSHIDMPVIVNLTKDFEEKELKKRLQIDAGIILNPKSSNRNETMIDHPSYDNQTKTFTYHNEVTLTFTSKKGANEILNVNGVAVPVYKNIFRISLKDLRDTLHNEDPDPTIYNIDITKDGESQLKFTIAIDAVSNDIAFKWVGWNPIDDPSQPTYYEQYLLTQPKIKDADGNLIDNPKYNELIDPDTGLISNYIFVKGETKYPFALDPLDAQGDKIDPKKSDADERYLKGYIAEGQIANSGIFNLEIEDLKNIDRIERVQLNPETLAEMGTPEPVSPTERQFSDEGLWHYIIYRKDYVEKLLDPRDIYNETTLATAGSTIHKLLYISNQVKDYGEDFLGLSFIAKNPDVQAFWNTIQSQHLKNFLIPKGIDSKTLQLAKYENIISFWLQYVSSVESDKGVPQPSNWKNLNDADEIDLIKMNETDEKAIKELIKDRIHRQWMWWISNKAEYGVDYIISDSKEGKQKLDDLDLSDFADNTTEPKEINLFVVALETSTILRGEKSFSALNNKDYDPDKVFSLSDLVLDQQIANYSEFTLEEFKNKYLYQYLLNEVNNQAPTEIKPINYQEDFVFSLTGVNGLDLMTDELTEEKLTNFLNNNHSELKVTIYAKKESLKLVGSKTMSFVNNFEAPKPPYVKTNVETIFTKLDLGELKDSNKNGYIDKEEIWDALIRLNGLQLRLDLKLSEFNVKITDLEDNNYSAQVTALDTNPNYQGHVTTTYFSEVAPNPVDMKTDITTIFTKLDLGQVKDSNQNGYIDKEEIWDALIRLNGLQLRIDLKLSEFNVKITDLEDNNYSAQITALDTNPNYLGHVTTTYFSEVPPNPEDIKTDITTIFTKLDLGQVKDSNQNGYIDKREIWDALIRLNGLQLQINVKFAEFSLKIKEVGENSYQVDITALDTNPIYQGQVTASYTAEEKPNPVDPDQPDIPDEKDPDEKKFDPVNLAWIIPLVVIGVGVIGFGIYWWTRKLKTKHKRMK